MSLENKYKINQLLKEWPKGAVFLTSWLITNGYSNQLLHRYKNSNWIESIGIGAVKQSGDRVTVEGALYALQHQSDSSIHIGGKTALAMLGKSHYLEFASKKVILFGEAKEKLPSWMFNYSWGVELNYFSSSFLPPRLGLVQNEVNNFRIHISGAARAMMECLYLAPKKQDLIECYELMEGLTNLRPQTVQQLLEACSSVKVKRLFLYMAEKAQHPWLNYLNRLKIDLGSGNRSLVKNGIYVPTYKITLPEELAFYGAV
jgi:hypothetical protein